MKRRRFLVSSLAGSALAGVAPAIDATALGAVPAAAGREYYELRKYQLRSFLFPARKNPIHASFKEKDCRAEMMWQKRKRLRLSVSSTCKRSSVQIGSSFGPTGGIQGILQRWSKLAGNSHGCVPAEV